MLYCSPILIATALALTLIYIVKPIWVNGTSMEPTLSDNELVFGSRLFREKADYGDIIVASIETNTVPESKKVDGRLFVIKRVIAKPNDIIRIIDNVVYVNDNPVDEPYLKEKMETLDISGFQLGSDEWWVMGDNRNNSTDSRKFGAIKSEDICYLIY